jgi:hypothetical protein
MMVKYALVCHHQTVAGPTDNILARKGLIQVLLGSVIWIMAEIKAAPWWIQFHVLFWLLALK